MNVDNMCMGCMNAEMTGDTCPLCGWQRGTQNSQHQLPVYTILNGRYLIGKALGQGGFGITYIAWELNLNIRLAIKEYYPELFVSRMTSYEVVPHTGEHENFFYKGRETFINEAKILAALSGLPGIVDVKNYFIEKGTAYIVMEYADGQTLKSYINSKGGRLSAAETLEMIEPVFESLTGVHAHNLIHRDISPDNIIVRPNGSLVLLDFGAARPMSEKGEQSNTVNVKHGYAPEEQYRTHGEQGAWTDEYALCATIYKAATGVIPPQSLERLYSSTPLTPPNDAGADFTPQQQAAIMKGLSIKAADRFGSISELYQALYQNKPIPQTPRQVQTEPKKKSKVTLTIQLSVIGVLVAAIAIIAVNKFGTNKTPVQAAAVTSMPAVTSASVVVSSSGGREQDIARLLSTASAKPTNDTLSSVTSSLSSGNDTIYILWCADASAFRASAPNVPGNNALLLFDLHALNGYYCVIYPSAGQSKVKSAIELLTKTDSFALSVQPLELSIGSSNVSDAYVINGYQIVRLKSLPLGSYEIAEGEGGTVIKSTNDAIEVTFAAGRDTAEKREQGMVESIALSLAPQIVDGDLYIVIDDLVKLGILG